ncbi:MAG: DUF503 domain-containing protein [Candidatus Omnitrophica bacterium]|nr:DUF503 domain-containing protein [Candidatus Omnitrophota bacterium]MCM8809400.1 DUF503 domain-containing protein [Candidatus Omnitrophota bacterium]MCM8811237.1 DUF503 domain-containing protein [Candidatus Omnitrophota bacterium]MCM8832482.1 DUF503 domain-containing protein [Candidatus Omnitrophota bacterium]
MFVGTLKFEVIIPGSTSLKDKRRVIQSIQNKIKSKFNVSIAEVDYQDKWQRAVIGLCIVNSEKKEIENICEKIKEIIFDNGEIFVINELKEIIYFGAK